MTVHTPVPVVSIEDEKSAEFADVLREQVGEKGESEPGDGIILDAHLLAVSMDYLEDQGGVSTDVGEGAVGTDDFVHTPFKAKIKNTNVLILGYLPIGSEDRKSVV